MTEHTPQEAETPSLDWLVANFEKVMADADHLTAEHVDAGSEDTAIAKLDRYMIYYLQPLLGKVHFESGSPSMEDMGTTEAPMDLQANTLIEARIMNIEHRRRELLKQKETGAL